MGITDKGLKASPKAILPHTAFWNWLFEKVGGRYVRAERGLIALRNRSKAYRLQGMRSTLCAEAAVTDLVGLMGQQEGKRVERP